MKKENSTITELKEKEKTSVSLFLIIFPYH